MKKLINFHIRKPYSWFLGLLPVLLILFAYIITSNARLAENPKDKLMPSFEKMSATMDRLATKPSKRTGELIFWQDTKTSLKRLIVGVMVAAVIGGIVGVITGSLPIMSALMTPIITIFSLIPPLAILPILFIMFSIGSAKIILIIIGIAPFIARDVYRATLAIPQEQLVKAETLGGNSIQIICRVIVPQVMPALISAVRLSLGAAWLFLIAGEAIASTEGLGYRTFLVRRYMGMDTIIPYVAWITFLAFTMDYILAILNKKLYPWHISRKG